MKTIEFISLKHEIMQALAEIAFIGTWRSFKVFKRTGAITLSTEKCFKEFQFMPGRLLIIKTYDQVNIKKIADTDQWSFFYRIKNTISILLFQNLIMKL